ncbi:hypothetical protein Bca4012_066069 [Brassica carinata]
MSPKLRIKMGWSLLTWQEELVPSRVGFRDFVSFRLKTGKKIRDGDKAILLSTVKKINRRVLVAKEDTRRVLDGIEGKSKGPFVDLWIYARFLVVFLAN